MEDGSPRRVAWFRSCGSGGNGSQVSADAQPWPGPTVHGIGARQPSRRPPDGSTMPLLLSGTAAVVGHASQHGDSLAAQLDETLANLDSLIATARAQRPSLAAHFGSQSRLKVYVRDADSMQRVDELLRSRLPADVPRVNNAVCNSRTIRSRW